MLSKDGIGYETSPLLSNEKGVIHAFTGRKGGVSKAPYTSLNLAFHVNDSSTDVEKNRGLVKKAFSLEKIFTLEQVHGDEVYMLKAAALPSHAPTADAVITDIRNTSIGILTADCLPVIFYDKKTASIGACHAGWRGTQKSISSKTVAAMEQAFGAKPENIIASLGPYIGPCCYVVGFDVYDAFADRSNRDEFFGKAHGSSRSLDIALATKLELALHGLREENISVSASCTSCRNNDFFSYRKDKAVTGRQLAFISLR
ncbi:MAG: peptidoglycan editing factor PgeF [Deltaproteobacteria bacterium]|nr:peptidoglycan editing factor PgeF [Deltaproteobacteria bacterium]